MINTIGPVKISSQYKFKNLSVFFQASSFLLLDFIKCIKYIKSHPQYLDIRVKIYVHLLSLILSSNGVPMDFV